MGVRDYTIYDMICRNAQIDSDRESIIFGSVRLTNRIFKEKCDRLAGGLLKSGVKEGDRLAVLARNSDQFLILLGAASKLGAIVVPINSRSQRDEIEFVLNDSAPKLMFAGENYQQIAVELAATVKSVDACYAIGIVDTNVPLLPLESLYAEQQSTITSDIPGDADFLILYTAAVEGRPRGATLSQSNIIAIALQMRDQYGLHREDCHICIIPFFHIAGVGMTVAVMKMGGKTIILDHFDAELTLDAIEKERGTFFFNFPPMLKKIMDKYELGSHSISSVKKIFGFDDPNNIERFIKILPGTRFYTGYGQTEAMALTGGPVDERPGSTGKPGELSNIAIMDDYGNGLPVGASGEICVRSPVVFKGYWNLPEVNAHIFRDGWHHTGDIGRFDRDGYLWYLKRKAHKELIKPGGENVYPAEVEKAILSHKAIAEACVIGVPDSEWKEAVKAVCVLKPGTVLKADELIEFVATKIARYKKPKHVVFVDLLPKTEDGEIDRDKVKKEHNGTY